MVAEPVSDRLDETGAFAVTGCGNGPRLIEAVTYRLGDILPPMTLHAIVRLTKSRLIGRKSRLPA